MRGVRCCRGCVQWSGRSREGRKGEGIKERKRIEEVQGDRVMRAEKEEGAVMQVQQRERRRRERKEGGGRKKKRR